MFNVGDKVTLYGYFKGCSYEGYSGETGTVIRIPEFNEVFYTVQVPEIPIYQYNEGGTDYDYLLREDEIELVKD